MLVLLKGIRARRNCAQGLSCILSFSLALPMARAVPGDFYFPFEIGDTDVIAFGISIIWHIQS